MSKKIEDFRMADNVFTLVKTFGRSLAPEGLPRAHDLKGAARVTDESEGLHRRFRIEARGFEALFESYRGSSPRVTVTQGAPERLERVLGNVEREAQKIESALKPQI